MILFQIFKLMPFSEVKFVCSIYTVNLHQFVRIKILAFEEQCQVC